MGRTGKDIQVRFSEIHIFSTNFQSSYRYSKSSSLESLDSKLFEDAAKQRLKGGSDPSGTMLSNIESTAEDDGKSTDIIASKLVMEPFTFFITWSISSQATVDSIIISTDAFISDLEKFFQKLDPEMRKALKKFGASSAATDKEKIAIDSLLKPFLDRYLQ